MSAQHTPGPWGVLSTAVGPAYTAVCIGQLNEEKGLNGASDEYAVCVVPLIHDESRANARLIAAAPDLLTALEDIVQASDANDGDSLMNAIQAAQTIIAKATGQ
jgi:hypothetical protein